MRLEAARELLKQIKKAGEPEEAELGTGEVQMGQADPVQEQLETLTQQMLHVVQACNVEKEILEEEFVAIR
jgi:hypothetical protein